MRTCMFTPDTYDEYVVAINHVTRALRRGRMADVKEWLGISERLLRLQSRLDEIRIAEDKRLAWRNEQPHRLKALEQRTMFPR